MNLILDHISHTYTTKKQTLPVLQDISLAISEGEFVALVGPSGCGKSTLLSIVGGLLSPTGGSARFEGVPAGLTPRTAMVFQEIGLLPWRTVSENISFGLEAMGLLSPAERDAEVTRQLDRIGLRDFADAYPHELSGGMRQRVGIARALAVSPDLLLMDEPFSALDAQTRLLLQGELISLLETTPLTTLYVTHNIREAVLLADRVVVLSGRPARMQNILEIPIPRRDRPAPESAKAIETFTQTIWDAVAEEARAAIREVRHGL